MRLQVNIAERTLHSRQQIANRPSRSSSIAKLNLIIERAVRAGWHVKESLRPGDSFARELALVRRQHLPDPPDAVNHAVVKVKCRVAGAGEHVVAGVAAESVVAAAVDADLESGVSMGCFRDDVQSKSVLTSPLPGTPCIVIWKS